jgi:uncharacterized membrane protein
LPQTLGPAFAVPAAIVLLLVPGLVFLSLLRAVDRDRLGADEKLFIAGSVSVAASSWLALFLAELGMFSTLRAAAIEAARDSPAVRLRTL